MTSSSLSRTRSSGCRLGEAHRLAHDHQELDRDAGPLAQLAEGDRAERGDPLVARLVHEVERQGPLSERLREALERQPGTVEVLEHPDPPNVTGREGLAPILEDLEPDQPIDVVEVGSGEVGELLSREAIHGCGAWPASTAASSARPGHVTIGVHPVRLAAACTP